MSDALRNPKHRKIMVRAFIAAAGLALSVGVVFAGIEGFRIFQEGRSAFEGMQEAVQGSSQEATREVGQETLQVSQETPHELRMIGIVTSPRIVRLDDVGDSQRLSVQGFYSDGSIGELEDDTEAMFSYTSSDSSVARVDPGGVVVGLKKGGTDIVVSYDNFHATVPVFVWGTVRSVPPIDPGRLLEVSDDGSAIVLNRVMVELEPGYGSADAEQVASNISGEVVLEFQTFPGFLVEFDGRTGEELDKVLAALLSDPRVAASYPDIAMVASQSPPSIDTLTLPYVRKKTYLDAGMGEAWEFMNHAPDSALDPVKIVMIDTDFVSRVPDRTTGFRFESGDNPIESDVLNSELDPTKIDVRSKPPYSVGGHGAAVASVMVAQNNGQGIRTDNSFSGVVSSTVSS